MSLFSSIGHLISAPVKGLAHAVTDPGKWASNLAHQATDPKTLLSIAGTLALPGVGGALGGALGAVPGLGGIAGALGSAGGAVTGALSKIPGLSSIEGLLGQAGGFLTGNGGLNALGVAQGLNATTLGKKANDYSHQALQSTEDAYNAKAPLRAQGLAGLTHQASPDLSGLTSIRSALQQAPTQVPSAGGNFAALQPLNAGSIQAPQAAQAQSLESLLAALHQGMR